MNFHNPIRLIIFLIILNSCTCNGYLLNTIKNLYHKFTRDIKEPKLNSTLEICDENKLLLKLASLQIINPERILLYLIHNGNVLESCDKISKSLKLIENDEKNCKPLENDNLYMMLLNGLNVANNCFCMNEKFLKIFKKNENCYKELYEEYIDCEGPADWFEVSNSTIVCQ